ncbi:hypothetical protein BHE74_00019050 [Ensete ventricosum]|nr:hypothetical protein GW17_00026172 [Ensete ventricosum]RWW73098.1 hypothetical protein BHE74_00019050 [Ensete ventricosum]RZR93643.1 hypothetical protein BHM03_00022183 [Ensete ventricosum]
MYRSTRLPVCEPPTTGRYCQNRSSAIDFGHRRSIEGEKGKKKKRKRRKKRRRRIPRVVLARTLSPPASRPRPHVVAARGSLIWLKIISVNTKVCNADGYRPYRAVHTGLAEDWYTVRSLPGDTTD